MKILFINLPYHGHIMFNPFHNYIPNSTYIQCNNIINLFDRDCLKHWMIRTYNLIKRIVFRTDNMG